MKITKSNIINIYSDESRHLAGQGPYMVVGAVWCDKGAVESISDKITLIKSKHNIPKHREIKWTKVSTAKIDYYKDLVEYFFKEDGLNFRAIIVPTVGLRHDQFEQTPDEFYYKMQYLMMINVIRKREANFKIYLDYKDSWSYQRSQKLASYLSMKIDFAFKDFSAQPVRSYESSLLQMADLLIGAVATKNSNPDIAGSKQEIIQLIEEKSFQQLNTQTPNGVDKINIFKWRPQK